MSLDAMGYLCCPACRGDFELRSEQQEGPRVASSKDNTGFRRWLLRKNTLYANKPPMELLPLGIAQLALKWVWRGLFYMSSFRKAHQAAEGLA